MILLQSPHGTELYPFASERSAEIEMEKVNLIKIQRRKATSMTRQEKTTTPPEPLKLLPLMGLEEDHI